MLRYWLLAIKKRLDRLRIFDPKMTFWIVLILIAVIIISPIPPIP